eukprot:359151-Chlamydomonas_euryale.AAC.3
MHASVLHTCLRASWHARFPPPVRTAADLCVPCFVADSVWSGGRGSRPLWSSFLAGCCLWRIAATAVTPATARAAGRGTRVTSTRLRARPVRVLRARRGGRQGDGVQTRWGEGGGQRLAKPILVGDVLCVVSSGKLEGVSKPAGSLRASQCRQVSHGCVSQSRLVGLSVPPKVRLSGGFP